MSRVANAAAQAAWTDWTAYDGALEALRHRQAGEDEVRAFVDTLAHFGLIQFRREEDGGRSYRMRVDAAERMREFRLCALRGRM